MTLQPPPFPERLRQSADPPRPRLRVVLLAFVPSLVLLLGLWRVQSVEVVACDGLPQSAISSCETMIGTPMILLRLDYIKRQIDTWPSVRSADVALDLGGTLTVRAHPAKAQASVIVAHSWHGVTEDGHLSGRLETPRVPVLHGFLHRPNALRTALRVVRRIESGSGTQALSARALLPNSFEIELQAPSEQESRVVAQVGREATAAEDWWCERMVQGEQLWSAVDLLYENRAVVGGAL